MGKFHQFHLLLWKNFLIQKRKVLVTCLEIGLPTFFAIILIFIRQRVHATTIANVTEWGTYGVHHLPVDLKPKPVDQPWKLYYSPHTAFTADVMSKTIHGLGLQFVSDAISFPNEDAMVQEMLHELEQANYNLSYTCTTLAAISFLSHSPEGADVDNAHITYKIRLPSSPRNAGNQHFKIDLFSQDTQWFTEFQFPLFQTVGPREKKDGTGGLPGYYREGFLSLQHEIDFSIKDVMLSNSSVPSRPGTGPGGVGVWMRRFPYPPYNDDNFVLVIQQQFPFILMLSFVFSALHIVKDVVHEKEKRLKEFMKMMGLSNWLHWLAWFIKYFLFLLISVSIMTLLMCVPVSEFGSIVGYTSWSVLLVFLLSYTVAVISFSFMVSTLFSKANSAAAAGGILFFVTYIPYFFIQSRYEALSWGTKIGLCTISNVAMALGGQVIGMFEGTGAGVQWSTISQGASVDDDFSLLDVILMLLLDSVLYGLVAWYVEAVWPGEYGIPLPFYFPFTRSYWCGTKPETMDTASTERSPLLGAASASQEFHDSEPQGLTPGIQICNLTKIFKENGKDPVAAVDHLSLNMYEGQITALLGHNGAGKTTTMSMLTGFIPPTSGTARVRGYDIQEDIAGVRQSLGLCPQHDVLFDTLTVAEHLAFFGRLKGCPANQVQSEADELIADFGLEPKRHVQSSTLSGGMKRKLSVAMALVGGSKVVILDEPTSGLDPGARRHTWEVLQRYRAGRTLLLTTHYMDEADVLGDRIAIMAAGRMQCCGTPLYLKNRYGAGYHMVIVKKRKCDIIQLEAVVQSHVPDAHIESNVGAELSIILPHESKVYFQALFEELESNRDELGIASFGVSVTTMEEVFLRVGESCDDQLKERLNKSMNSSIEEGRVENVGCASSLAVDSPGARNTGLVLYTQQYLALLYKRMLHTWRNGMVTVTQLFIPLFFTIMALIVLQTTPSPKDASALSLNLSDFGVNYVPYSSSHADSISSEQLADQYAKYIKSVNTESKLKYVDNATYMEDYLVSAGERSLSTYNNRYLIAAEFHSGPPLCSDHPAHNASDEKICALAHFNDQAFHTPAMSLNAFSNAVLRYVTENPNAGITTINHPLPRTLQQKINDDLTRSMEGFSIAFNVMFGFAFLSSTFVLFLIKERDTKAKHCQFVSGVHSFNFWAATFTWDYVNYMCPCILLLVVFAGFNVEAYTLDNRLGYILLLLMLYGWAMLPFMYILSFIFTVPATGFVWLSMFNILSGVATTLAVQILRIPPLKLASLSENLEWAFLVFLPNFCLEQGLTDFYENYQFLQICEQPTIKLLCTLGIETPCCKGNCGDLCLDYQENYLSVGPGGIGRMLIFLAMQGVLYFLILFLFESQLPQKVWYSLCDWSHLKQASGDALVEEDGDVARERRRVTETPLDGLLHTDILLARQLHKTYGSLVAVDSISFGIPAGECFGLLGVNGAGKTSTFKMLTGDEVVTSGNALIGGYDVKSNIDMVRQLLGYCPQFDALIDQLTGRETLTMYGRLRGVTEDALPSVVDNLIIALLLQEHADKLVQAYSGGNKRKLSTAIALIGAPPLVFLDEPSSGMDPVARRLLWDTLSAVRASGRTLVLTSHSMEECEALCTKIAIMVNGQFKCLGSPQHLKNKFGEGYTLVAKVSLGQDQEELLQRLVSHLQQKFPGCVLHDRHQGMIHLHITDTTISWASLFGTLESIREKFHIEDYSISQTTLEQIFLNFARAQVPPQEQNIGCCSRMHQGCRHLCACLQCCRREEEMRVVVQDHEVVA